MFLGNALGTRSSWLIVDWKLIDSWLKSVGYIGTLFKDYGLFEEKNQI